MAVLQCVEDGKLDLDEDIRPMIPKIGKHGIITGFDDEQGSAILKPDNTPITLRLLLSHTSGHEYEWLNPYLTKWRALRNEPPLGGPTVEGKSALPLVFAPGTGFAYGAGHDWAGRLVEVATGSSLEDFMRKRIWAQLGIENEMSFFPKTKENMRDRIADISTLDKEGKPPAVDAPEFDMLLGATECHGGAGVYTSAKAYYTFLTAVLRRHPMLLTPSSYAELFRPQLDEQREQALNDYIALSPDHTNFLGLQILPSVRKTWSFAGLVAKEAQPGRFNEGTVMWAGVGSTMWFIDSQAGVCGTAFCQIVPALHPSVVALHAQFQSGVFEVVNG